MNQGARLTSFSIPNGMVGRSYSEPFDLGKYATAPLSEYSIEGLEEIGLAFDASENRIHGTPAVEGAHPVVIRYRFDGIEAEEPLVKECQILINPDPRSLWKNLESDRSDPYWRPDEQGSVRREGERHIIAASKRGRSHAHEGKFRDDDFDVLTTGKDGWYVIAVADGAGSARYARRGAEIACSVSTSYLATYLPGVPDSVFDALLKQYSEGGGDDPKKAITDLLYNSLGRAAFSAFKRIQEEASQQGAQVKDYSTTLLLSAYKRIKVGHFVASFWVGDGAIGLYSKEDSLHVLGQPDGGQFAGQTRFLTMPEIFEYNELLRRLRFAVVDDFTALVMMTDGVTDPKFQTDNNLLKLERWDALWSELASAVNLDRGNPDAASELMQWLDFWSPGNHDDRTIAILY